MRVLPSSHHWPGRSDIVQLGPFAPFVSRHAFGVALTLSLLTHGLTPAVFDAFIEPPKLKRVRDRGLEVILVNSRSDQKPDIKDTQALAQVNQDGGGNTDQKRRRSSPLPPTVDQPGNEMLELRRRAAALKARQRELLVASQGAESRWRAKNAPAKSAQIASGHDLAEAAREMMRLEGEIARNTEAYNSRPRKVNIGTRVQEYRFAQYVEDWRQKVERWGTLNYPEGARGKIYGELVLSVTIGRDGHVIDFTIDRPSPHKLLNEAARKIIMMAAPYAPFPPSIARDTDQVVITRTATFTKGNSLETR